MFRTVEDLYGWLGVAVRIFAQVCSNSTQQTHYMHDVPDRPWQKVETDLITISLQPTPTP